MPNSAPLFREAAGGLSTVTPSEVTLTESPGEVLLMTQEDHPPEFHVHDMSLDRGVASLGGPFSLASAVMLGVMVWTNCSDRILTFGIRRSIRSPAKVGLVITKLLTTSPVVSWRGWETPHPSTRAQLSFFAQPPLS